MRLDTCFVGLRSDLIDGWVAFPFTDGTWKAPAVNAAAIVHIVHDHAHYRPVVAIRRLSQTEVRPGGSSVCWMLRPLLGQREL